MAEKSNPLAVAALVLGIIGIPLASIWIPQILALIFGIVSYRKADTHGKKGFALAGIILGAVGILIAILSVIFLAAMFSTLPMMAMYA